MTEDFLKTKKWVVWVAIEWKRALIGSNRITRARDERPLLRPMGKNTQSAPQPHQTFGNKTTRSTGTSTTTAHSLAVR